MLDRSGEGGPAVVFLPGAGLTGLDFLNVQAEIARFATAVVYDRAGTGWSDAVKLPRTAAEVARELRALLGAAGIAPPYVLVGHSLGGAYARRYAQLFPAEVAGLVFLDPAHEGYQTDPPMALWAQVRMAAKALPALLNGRRFYRPLFARTLEAWPDALRERLTDYHVRFWRRSLDEAANLNGPVLDEIKTGGPMPEVPLVVLTAMGIDPFMAPFMDAGYLREVNVRKAGHYDALAASVPGGENRRIADAGHSTLHTDRPHAVVQAVRDVVEAIRTTRAI
jgi:pimeloyl-ACP methyl ester carboxylesterase